MNDDNLELLTQGSVWVRNKGKKVGEQRKVLWITNQSLPEKAQAQHPPQVIYADDEGNLYNRDIVDFFEQYSFFNIDPELEGKLENLFVFNESDYDDPEDTDVEEESDDEELELLNVAGMPTAGTAADEKSLADWLAEEPAQSAEEILAAQLNNVSLVEAETTMTFIMSAGNEPALSADLLSDAFIAYAQEPNKSLSLVQHKLLFRLSDAVTIHGLTQAFTPDDPESACVDAFAVSGPHYHEVIAWTDSIGVFLELAQGVAYAAVILGTEGDSGEEVEFPITGEAQEGEGFIEGIAEEAAAHALQEVNAAVAQDVTFTEQVQVTPVIPQVTVVSNVPPNPEAQ